MGPDHWSRIYFLESTLVLFLPNMQKKSLKVNILEKMSKLEDLSKMSILDSKGGLWNKRVEKITHSIRSIKSICWHN